MFQRLKIKLYDGWREVKCEGALATYIRGSSSDSSLQFSQAQKSGSVLPEDTEKLIGMCEGLTRKIRGRREMLSGSGKCGFGIFGTVVAKGDSPAHVQVWVLQHKNDFILITHTCETEPDPQEIREARGIALMTTCGPCENPTPDSLGSRLM
jgi:hypothetical protein